MDFLEELNKKSACDIHNACVESDIKKKEYQDFLNKNVDVINRSKDLFRKKYKADFEKIIIDCIERWNFNIRIKFFNTMYYDNDHNTKLYYNNKRPINVRNIKNDVIFIQNAVDKISFPEYFLKTVDGENDYFLYKKPSLDNCDIIINVNCLYGVIEWFLENASSFTYKDLGDINYTECILQIDNIHDLQFKMYNNYVLPSQIGGHINYLTKNDDIIKKSYISKINETLIKIISKYNDLNIVFRFNYINDNNCNDDNFEKIITDDNENIFISYNKFVNIGTSKYNQMIEKSGFRTKLYFCRDPRFDEPTYHKIYHDDVCFPPFTRCVKINILKKYSAELLNYLIDDKSFSYELNDNSIKAVFNKNDKNNKCILNSATVLKVLNYIWDYLNRSICIMYVNNCLEIIISDDYRKYDENEYFIKDKKIINPNPFDDDYLICEKVISILTEDELDKIKSMRVYKNISSDH